MHKLSKEKNCLTCDYSIEQPIAEDLTKRSVCIFNPPTVCAIGAAGGIAHVTAFPPVVAGMLCAKWEAKVPVLSVA